MTGITIEDRKIGGNHPCFIIAEAGVNHNGDPRLAKKMIDMAKKARADAIKFQTFHTEDVVIKNAAKAEYQKNVTGSNETQFDMIKKLELTEKDFKNLSQYAHKKNIIFLSTPFDLRSVAFLNNIGVPAMKIPSGEINNPLLLSCIGRTRKPVILSTGMATIPEIKSAIGILSRNGSSQIALLHCITNYPADIRELNLRVIQTLQKKFRVPVGFSDHSLGILGSIAAVAMGACIIEKHFTLDKGLKGPDHQASMDPEELAALVKGIRDIETAKGDGIRKPTASEIAIKRVARRSIVSIKKIPAGSIIDQTMIAVKRPGTGIDPLHFEQMIGRKTKVMIPRDAILEWDMVE